MSERDSICAVEEKPVVEYRAVEGFPNYRVGDDGSVWSINGYGPKATRKPGEWHRLKPTMSRQDNRGRFQVMLRNGPTKITKPIHRLVLECFVGPCPDGCCACHNNGQWDDNRLRNLRWDTQANNIADAIAHGTWRVGGKAPNTQLTDDRVRQIRADHLAGKTLKAIAIESGATVYAVRRIIEGQTWRHLLSDSERAVPRMPRCRKCKGLREVLSEAQHLFGMAESIYADDRNPNRADKLHKVLRDGFTLCLNAIGAFDGGRHVA